MIIINVKSECKIVRNALLLIGMIQTDGDWIETSRTCTWTCVILWLIRRKNFILINNHKGFMWWRIKNRLLCMNRCGSICIAGSLSLRNWILLNDQIKITSQCCWAGSHCFHMFSIFLFYNCLKARNGKEENVALFYFYLT